MQRHRPESESDDPWAKLAAERDLLEYIVEEDYPFAPYAERILRELDRRNRGAD